MRKIVIWIGVVTAASLISWSANAFVSKHVQDNIALVNIARECRIPITPEASAFVLGQRSAASANTVKEADAFSKKQLKEWASEHGRNEACRRFRSMLSDMGWL